MIIDCLGKAIFIFLIYNIVILALFGVPKSLSNTYYLFKERNSNLKFLFPSMMIILAFLLSPVWLEISKNSDFQFTAFLSVLGVLFVGGAPAFKKSSMENAIHTFAAYFCAASAIAWICLVTSYWYIILIVFIIILILALITKTWKSSYVYWIEIVAFISTFASIIAHYINKL